MGPKAESDLEKNLDDPCARSLGRSDDIRRDLDWSVIHSIELDAGVVILIQKIRKNSKRPQNTSEEERDKDKVVVSEMLCMLWVEHGLGSCHHEFLGNRHHDRQSIRNSDVNPMHSQTILAHVSTSFQSQLFTFYPSALLRRAHYIHSPLLRPPLS